MSSDRGNDSDPFERMIEPMPPAEAAGYIIELLSSLAHFAHISDLNNSSAMISAASQVVAQECRLLTDGPPKFTGESPEGWPYSGTPPRLGD
jgi:hypothetical protein